MLFSGDHYIVFVMYGGVGVYVFIMARLALDKVDQ
jgi:hypothetical protein